MIYCISVCPLRLHFHDHLEFDSFYARHYKEKERDNLKHKGWPIIEDGGGIRWGDHFLPHKFIKRTFQPWINSTKQLLNAGRGHQALRKADHCLQKQGRKNIKDEKRDKGGREGALSQEGSPVPGRESQKERSFQTPGNTLAAKSVASLRSTEGDITGREKN